jgi:hypothetical protein
MRTKTRLLFTVVFLSVYPVFAETRSFESIFPGLAPEIRTAVFSQEGYFKSSNRAAGLGILNDSPGAAAFALDSRIRDSVLGKGPGFLIEAMRVIPGPPDSVDILAVYNVLGNIRDLKGRLYTSATRQKIIPLFEDASRVESASRTRNIPDPAPASEVPRSETVYIRLKDVNFGNSFYRGDITLDQYGLRYCLSNNKNISYLFVPVIKEEKFTAQLYFEPIQEGVLIYSIAGADVSDFVASRIDMPSAISKRLAVIIGWVADGIARAAGRA